MFIAIHVYSGGILSLVEYMHLKYRFVTKAVINILTVNIDDVFACLK